MEFTKRLELKVEDLRQKAMEHPFVDGLGSGKLPKEIFKYYLVQDYLYLIDYAKIFALGAIKARDIELIQNFTNSQNLILNSEMETHRGYMKEFGISLEEANRSKPSQINLSYTHYMDTKTAQGGVEEFVAAILPCMWGYLEIADRLVEKFGIQEDNLYKNWLEMYTSDEFREQTYYFKDLINQIALPKTSDELDYLEEIFVNTTKYEYLFWDMAYKQESWQV